MNTLDRLRQAAQQVMIAEDELLEAWQTWSRDGKSLPILDDVPLLEELIFRKIHPINAFELLVRLNVEAVITSLLRRYLANHLSPDRGFGGFEFDMSSMLDDLVLIGGEHALMRLVRHPEFNQEMLQDHRFRRAACEALQTDDVGFTSWLASHPKQDTSA